MVHKVTHTPCIPKPHYHYDHHDDHHHVATCELLSNILATRPPTAYNHITSETAH